MFDITYLLVLSKTAVTTIFFTSLRLYIYSSAKAIKLSKCNQSHPRKDEKILKSLRLNCDIFCKCFKCLSLPRTQQHVVELGWSKHFQASSKTELGKVTGHPNYQYQETYGTFMDRFSMAFQSKLVNHFADFTFWMPGFQAVPRSGWTGSGPVESIGGYWSPRRKATKNSSFLYILWYIFIYIWVFP